MINIVLGSDFIFIDGNYFPIVPYYKNKILDFDEEISIDDDVYRVKLYFDFNDYVFKTFLALKDGDDYLSVSGGFKFYAYDFVISRDLYPFGEILDVYEDINDSIEAIEDIIVSAKGSLEGSIGSVRGSILGEINFVKGSINSAKDAILNKCEDINVDFSPIEDKLSNLDKKCDLFSVLDISNMIDEKLSQIFNLKSLNGSNGSKFKDGSIVKVKGYDGDWKVDGSYPLLNSDGVTIIVYKVVQDDRVL